MAFIDTLAFQQATLLLAAVLIGYVGVLAAFAMRRNDAAGLQSLLKGSAIPIGSLGGVATILAVYGEMTWPLPGSYNILFTDIYLLFGVTLVVLAVSLATSTKLQFAGLFALVAGGLTISYGWAGYGLGMTKDPLETFLLYGAFGLTGILAFPATVMVDHYVAHPDSSVFVHSAPVARSRPSLSGASRAVQPVVPGTAPAAPAEPSPKVPVSFRVPVYINATLILFLVVVALAAIAALFYLDSTVPAHLASPP
jgi:putative membrane protein